MQIQVFQIFTWPRDQKIPWLARLCLPNISCYSAKFEGYRYCGNSAIILFICHVTTGWKVHVNQWVGSLYRKLTLCQVWLAIDIAKSFSFGFFKGFSKVNWIGGCYPLTSVTTFSVLVLLQKILENFHKLRKICNHKQNINRIHN